MIKSGSRVESASYGLGTVQSVERDRPGESLAWVRWDCYKGTRLDSSYPTPLAGLRAIPTVAVAMKAVCPCGDSFHGECLGCVPYGC